MERYCTHRTFVTERRIQEAVRRADALAAEAPSLAAHDCAAAAVQSVFGRWIAHPDGTIRADRLPLYFQLSNRVESRLGLHRKARSVGRGVASPIRAPLPDLAVASADAYVGATAIAI